MGKYIFYVIFALIVAFTANYFGFIHIPWLDLPVSSSVYKEKVETFQKKIDEQTTAK